MEWILTRTRWLLAALALALAARPAALLSAEVEISGELKQWHKVTLTVDGPLARETDSDPNPFADDRFEVVFQHHSGRPRYVVPGYFAADGRAAETSAAEGKKWRAHLSPDKPGRWTYRISFVRGKHAAIGEKGGEPLAPLDGLSGEFTIAPTDKSGRDFRAGGRLEYAGARYLRFAGTGEWFLKAGPDSPENLLACADFDGTWSNRAGAAPRPGEAAPAALKTWLPHARDFRPGDPTWKDGKGRGLIGALDYLAGKGCTAISFLSYNVGGDGDDVWPFIAPRDKLHYDCSKLDQWGIVFDHAARLGLLLHVKLQEQENDDLRLGGEEAAPADVPAALDGGDLGVERKLYLREMAARFGHSLGLEWNLGEENSQSTTQQVAMARYLRDIDPYPHPIVVHTFPDWQERVYVPLLGDRSALTGASLQNRWDAAHERTLRWVDASRAAGRPWVVSSDEQNDAGLGVPPDPGYAGSSGQARERSGRVYTLDDIRKRTLWGTLMAGGAGVQYYFGYDLPQNDLGCEDWRSRDRSWDHCRIALEFFHRHVPFWRMASADALAGAPARGGARYCLAAPGEVYLVYLPRGGAGELDLGESAGQFRVDWFDPRRGGELQRSGITLVKGPGKVDLGPPPSEPEEDWAVLVRRAP